MAEQKQQEIEPEQQNRQTLTDEQILQLERIGQKDRSTFWLPTGYRMVFG